MTSSKAFRPILVSVVLLALCAFSIGVFFPARIAFASLPESYLNAVADGENWMFDDDYLGIDAVKAVVDGWKNDSAYDFSVLEENPVIIAVIDTGINPDHDIFGAVATSEGTAEDVLLRDSEGNIIGINTVGTTTSDDISDGATYDKHGTHVAGIVAALIHALDLESYIKIMPIKAGSYRSDESPAGNYFNAGDVSEAIDFALENGADVINMSLAADTSGMNYTSRRTWQNVVTASDAEKAVFVAAAGNITSQSQAGNEYYPAADDDVIGVMNYASDGAGGKVLSEKSNYGTTYDICAPGAEIMSADGSTDDGYKYLSGTSMASPVVAFAAALIQLKFTACVDGAFEPTASNVRSALELHCDEYLELPSGEEAPVLNLPLLATLNFELDEEHGVYLNPDCLVLSVQGGAVTTGDSVLVNITAEFPTLTYPDFLKFIWYYTVDGIEYASYGAEFSKYLRIDSDSELTFRLEISLYGSSEPLAVKTVEVPVDYIVASADNTVPVVTGGEKAGDNAYYLKQGNEMVISADVFGYIAPSAVVVWYVNGEEIGTGRSYTFLPSATGKYEISATVDGETAIDSLTVTVRVLSSAEYFNLEIAGYVLAGLIVLSLAFTLALYLYRRSARKRAERECGGEQ